MESRRENRFGLTLLIYPILPVSASRVIVAVALYKLLLEKYGKVEYLGGGPKLGLAYTRHST